jgi:hypothetical protein
LIISKNILPKHQNRKYTQLPIRLTITFNNMRNFYLLTATALVLTITACDPNKKKVVTPTPHPATQNKVTDTAGKSDPAVIVVSNGCTPNSDAINDVFAIGTSGLASIDVRYYDTAGTLLQTSTSLSSYMTYSPTPITSGYKPALRGIQATTLAGNKIGFWDSVYMMACIPKHKTKSSFVFADQLAPNGSGGWTNAFATAENITTCP